MQNTRCRGLNHLLWMAPYTMHNQTAEAHPFRNGTTEDTYSNRHDVVHAPLRTRHTNSEERIRGGAGRPPKKVGAGTLMTIVPPFRSGTILTHANGLR